MPLKEYYDCNKNKYRKQSLDYYLAHRKEMDKINKTWAKNNSEKIKNIKARYREKHKEEIRDNQIRYCETHKTERYERKKRWKRDNPKKEKNMRLKYIYGITYENYIKILQDQKNKCGVCNTEFKDSYKFPDLRSPCVDHNHLIKGIRGILCRGCNSGIGFFNDDVSLLEAALQWLKKKEYDIVYRKRIKESLYRQILNDQNNKCGICQKDLLCVRMNLDHNHSSMKVRGLLCAKCNKALGFLKDDLRIIKNSLKWLKWKSIL